MPYFELSDGERMFYKKNGDGNRNIVLIPGWSLTSSLWEKLIPEIDADEFTIYSLDLAGFGNSDKERVNYSIEVWASDIAEFCKGLNLVGPILVGHSMSGLVVLKILISGLLDVEKAIIFDSSHRSSVKVENMIAAVNNGKNLREDIRKLETRFFENIDEKDLEDNVNKVCNMGKNVIIKTMRAMMGLDFSGAIGKVQIPVLVIYGENDRIRSRKEVQEMSNSLPQGSFVEIHHSGHCPMYENPAEVKEVMMGFID